MDKPNKKESTKGIKMKYTYLEFKRSTRQWIFPWTPFVSPISDRVLFDRMHIGHYEIRRYTGPHAFIGVEFTSL